MTTPTNNIFLDTLIRGRAANAPVPVWLMRQAGRYSPAFRQLRAGMEFLQFCKQPDLCTRATMLPMGELSVDAAILFADILLVPEALGQPLRYEAGEGPVFGHAIRSQDQINQLSLERMREHIGYVYQTVRQVRAELKADKALIGFAGAPFTVASYMVEGRGGSDHRHVKQMMWSHDGRWHALMEVLTQATVEYLTEQVKAGAQALQLFDTWLEVLAPQDFEQHIRPWVGRIFDALRPLNVPLIYFGKGTGALLPWLDPLSCTAFSVDVRADLTQFQAHFGTSRALQGNLDPVVLYGDDALMDEAIGGILESMRSMQRYVFNLGHGLSPDMELPRVQRLVDRVHELSLALGPL